MHELSDFRPGESQSREFTHWLFEQWGIDFHCLRDDCHIQGSPERTIERAVIQDKNGSLFLLEKYTRDKFDHRHTVARAVDFLMTISNLYCSDKDIECTMNKNTILHGEEDQKFFRRGKMRQDKIIQEIDKLDVSEKILLVGDIWDSIAQDCSAMPPLPEWQKKELDKRLADYDAGKLTTRDWKDVHNEIRKQYK